MINDQPIKLLDHGYIKVVDVMGSDQAIVEAARMSTDKGFLGWGPRCTVCDTLRLVPETAQCQNCFDRAGERNYNIKAGDEKLLAYLYNNKHSTPFEMGQIVFEVQAPIFVFREWHRHRTASYNEMSARYTPLPDLYYTPTPDRLMLNSKTNKQAGTIKGAKELTYANADTFIERSQGLYDEFQDLYEWALDAGIPKELARCPMPVAHYSRMRASANLRNWLAFMTLRSASNAQWEIRQYSDAINVMMGEHFPRTMELFNA